MSVKIKISYEHPEELKAVLRRLAPVVKCCRISRKQEGRFKRAYVEITRENQSSGSEKPNKT